MENKVRVWLENGVQACRGAHCTWW